MKTLSIVGAACALAALLVPPDRASANVYELQFTADTTSASDSNYGYLFVDTYIYTLGTTLPASVTNIAGTVTVGAPNGTVESIIALSSYAGADNFLYGIGSSADDFSFAGVSFSVSTADGVQDYNIYSWNGGIYALNSVIDPVGYPQNGVDAASLVTTVPETSTWAMMLIGFAGLGFAGYRKARKVSATVAV